MATTANSTQAGGDRGREADSPWQMPPSGWRDALLRTWRESSGDNINLIAAGVAFYFFLAFVPLLAALVLTYGLLADPETVVRHVRALSQMLPTDAARLIGEQLQSVTQAARGEKGIGLLLALLLSLYGAMRGASSIITALNIAYDEEETRGFIKTTVLAFLMTLGVVAVAVLAILGVSVLGYIDEFLSNLSPAFHDLIRIATWIILALVVSSAIAAIYRYAPDRDESKWRWLSPGSLLATVLWLIATLLFGFYVANFGSYNATYGSLGAVVVLLMWLYLSAYVLLMGAELNAELERQTRRDTTRGAPQPQGQRGAYAADTVGETP